MSSGRWRTPGMPARCIRNETAAKSVVAQFYGSVPPGGLNRRHRSSTRYLLLNSCRTPGYLAPAGGRSGITEFMHALILLTESMGGGRLI